MPSTVFTCAVILLLSLTISFAHAMLVSPIEEYATLTMPSEARSGKSGCVVKAGTRVQVLGRPSSLSEKKPSTFMFVHIAEGPCTGYELTIDERYLTDFSETPSVMKRDRDM